MEQTHIKETPALKIGRHSVYGKASLAPMAGITDHPFRQLCQSFGAAWVTSEMVTSNRKLWQSKKTKRRLAKMSNSSCQPCQPRQLNVIQIAGSDPQQMAEAARACADLGADIIDINMGCPAKKVCSKAAGSALLKDEKLISQILKSVVDAVQIPVTLKFRTGWNTENKNATHIAKIAEASGIALLTLHGRTRACGFKGQVEYDTIAKVVASAKIPIIANGDITTPEKAQKVLHHTGAHAVMIGRGAQGRPWLFREINHFLDTGGKLCIPAYTEIAQTVEVHLSSIYNFYGNELGVRIARKHVKWYVDELPGGKQFSRAFNTLINPDDQLASAKDYFERLIDGEVMAA